MSAGRVIYVVFQGEYSDRRPIVGFEDEAAAGAFAATLVKDEDGEGDVDALPIVTEPPGRTMLRHRYVRVDPSGEVKRNDVYDRPVWDLPGVTRYESTVTRYESTEPDHWHQRVFSGVDLERVDRAAQEWIARAKANAAGIA